MDCLSWGVSPRDTPFSNTEKESRKKLVTGKWDAPLLLCPLHLGPYSDEEGVPMISVWVAIFQNNESVWNYSCKRKQFSLCDSW